MVVRTPMGGRRGYGPTHSQSLEKMLLGVPGLKVVAPNTLGDPADLLCASISDDDPVLFIEHKLLYTRQLLDEGNSDLLDFQVDKTSGAYPTFTLRPTKPAHLTLACYGYNFELARLAALDLIMEHEIFSEIILYSQLSPFILEPLFHSLERTGKLVTVEEGTLSLGWGAELAARSAEKMSGLQIRRVAALDLPIANAKSLEDKILPSVQDIINAGLSILE
jgi:pyruvate/2-oxoglutarate/acetoin dehydrogenase E1 component